MKKLTSIVLVLSLVMCLFAGCSSTKPAETTAAAAPAGTETAAAAETLKSDEPIVIGLLDAFSGDRAMNGEYTGKAPRCSWRTSTLPAVFWAAL